MSDLWLSEKVVIFHTLDAVVVFSEWLPNIIGVDCVLRGTLLLSACVSLSNDLTTGHVILFEHFNGKDVIDLDIMSGKTVVKEAGWEHHVVTGEPELRLILLVE